ncbi:hypothetical protein [Chamaesiphon sp.]|uniref:hypothetical protein n=1 Tax=Chamaesiphon sp. TaxID=2814140 RepID=UPI00359424CA
MKSFRSYLTKLDRSKQSPDNLGTYQPTPHQKPYRALLATSLIAGSQLLAMMSASANPVPTPSQPSPLVPTRVILNGSFEQPAQGADGAGYGINESYNNPSPGAPVIWRTTEPGNAGGTYKDQLELWKGIRTSNGGQSTSSGAGSQYAEINASTNASIYQDICVRPSENVKWDLLHAARKKSTADPTNIMRVSITDPAAWLNSKTPPSIKLYESNALTTTYSQRWQAKTGTWLMSSNTSIKALRFAFQAIQGSDGDISYGNFIDDVKLNLSPLIDFLPTNGGNVNLATTTEGNPTSGNPPYYYLSLRINGITTTASTVRINLTGLNATRPFTLGAILKGNATLTGLSATSNAITSGAKEIILTIPAGTYDANVVSNYIHIPIDFSDTTKQRNDNLIFTLTTVAGGGTAGVADLSIGSTNCTSERITVETLLRDDDYEERVQLPVPLTVAARRSK